MFEYALSVMIFLPILAGMALFLFPISRGASRLAGLIVSLVILLMGVELFIGFSGTGGMQYLENRPWIESLGVSYGLGIDGISLLVLMTGAVLFPMVFTFPI